MQDCARILISLLVQNNLNQKIIKNKKMFQSLSLDIKAIFPKLLGYVRVKNARTLILACLVFGFSIFSLTWYVTATNSTNIDAESKFAWSENGGWLNFSAENGGVMIEDAALSGYAWSENLGWISLNCSNNNSCGTVSYAVANDGEGHLSGYGWGENIGWVNFAPTNGGVTIDSSGNFSGYAWGENIGWVIFNCADVNACADSSFKVKTSWLPLSARDDDEESDDDGKDVEISDVHFSTTDSTIVINWKTNHNADSHVRWGENKNLEKEKNDNTHEKKHQTTLRNLKPDTRYYFRLKSTDGNDKSDSSRIHEASTKPVSAIFSKREWKSAGGDESDGEDYEKVEIEVTDKNSAELKKEEKTAPVEINENAGKDKNSGPSLISRMFEGLKGGLATVFSGTYDLALGGQRKISKFFDLAGEKIAFGYGVIVAKFNEQKATEIAKINQAKFFTTNVFNRNEKKILAEMRFQILDKKDNPIPNLETMLFSDPQSAVTDENGVASFKDVPIGSHTLAFDYQNEKFEKKVAIADTLTDEGKVRAEVVEVKAEKEKIAIWMWVVIILLACTIVVAAYFAKKYYQLKKATNTA